MRAAKKYANPFWDRMLAVLVISNPSVKKPPNTRARITRMVPSLTDF